MVPLTRSLGEHQTINVVLRSYEPRVHCYDREYLDPAKRCQDTLSEMRTSGQPMTWLPVGSSPPRRYSLFVPKEYSGRG